MRVQVKVAGRGRMGGCPSCCSRSTIMLTLASIDREIDALRVFTFPSLVFVGCLLVSCSPVHQNCVSLSPISSSK